MYYVSYRRGVAYCLRITVHIIPDKNGTHDIHPDQKVMVLARQIPERLQDKKSIYTTGIVYCLIKRKECNIPAIICGNSLLGAQRQVGFNGFFKTHI